MSSNGQGDPAKDNAGVGRLREAYEQLDYKLVDVHDNLTVPSASPAFFDYDESPGVTDADEIAERFDQFSYVFIDVYANNGDDWYKFAVDATVYHEELAEKCKLKVSTAGVCIFQSDLDPLSWDMFRDIVDVVETALETRLVYRGESDD